MIQFAWNMDAPTEREPFCYWPKSTVRIYCDRKKFSQYGKRALKELYDKVRQRPDVKFEVYADKEPKDMPPLNLNIYVIKEIDYVRYKIPYVKS